MELLSPSEIRLDEDTIALLGDMNELARQVNEIRPLGEEILRQVKDQLLGERVFSSNAIEGSTLTLRETRLVLETKTILDGRRKREAQEALNLGDAALEVERLYQEPEAGCDPSEFVRIHELVMRAVNDPIAGVLRHRDVMIRGAKHQPPDWNLVSDLVDELFRRLRNSEENEGLKLAAWAHWAITRVHPFEDGNGRMARLWQDMILLRANLTVAIIRPHDREVYLESLGRADDGDFNPLVQLICGRVMATLQVYINAQEAADELKGWAEELVGEASTQELERRKLEYLRWRHAVERVQDAFERCAALINRSGDRSRGVLIRFQDIIDQPTWETLKAGGTVRKSRFFSTIFRSDHNILMYIFYFGRHSWQEADDEIGLQIPAIAILVGEKQAGEQLETYLDEIENDPVSLREMIVLDKRLIRRRVDSTGMQSIYDPDIKPIDVAKDFFQEVLLKKLK
jgi:fido (protein-threonine AMPylation protein)